MKIPIGAVIGLGGNDDFYKVMRDWESHPSIWQRIKNFFKYGTFSNDIVVIKCGKPDRTRGREVLSVKAKDLVAESVIVNFKNFIGE